MGKFSENLNYKFIYALNTLLIYTYSNFYSFPFSLFILSINSNLYFIFPIRNKSYK